jgi:hypothetical protein
MRSRVAASAAGTKYERLLEKCSLLEVVDAIVSVFPKYADVDQVEDHVPKSSPRLTANTQRRSGPLVKLLIATGELLRAVLSE